MEVTVGAGASPGHLLYPRPPTPAWRGRRRRALHLGLVDGVGSSDRGVRRGAPRCARPRPLLSPAGEPDDRAGYQTGQDPSSGGGEGHDGKPKPGVG